MRLLIADDEMIERQVLYRTLQENLGDGCQVLQAANSRETLRIYEGERIQTATLDIEALGINGIEAAQQVRQADKDCYVISLTTFDEFSCTKRAITVRVLDYLLKPHDGEELILVVEEATHIAGEYQQDGGGENRNENEIPASLDTEGPEDEEHVHLSKIISLISQYIHENYMFGISVQDATRTMSYSEAYFCKLFKQCSDQNFTSCLIQYQIKEAKKMLGQPAVNVKEVGRAVGYGDSNYFAKIFKHITGQSPTEYRLSISQKG